MIAWWHPIFWQIRAKTSQRRRILVETELILERLRKGNRLVETTDYNTISKHIPLRTCIACRRTTAKHELLRLARTEDDRVILDRTGTRGGRGAYLCWQPTCWQQALKRRSLERALRLKQLHPDDRVMLQQMAEQLGHTGSV